MDCPDCGVAPCTPHLTGCDVARCKWCGMQNLSCPHLGAPMTRWTGRWPGQVEVAEGLACDLNDLMLRAVRGDVAWNRDAERWFLVWVEAPTVD